MRAKSSAHGKAAAFLDRHGLGPDAVDPEAALKAFLAEMDRGLAGADSSLAMLPSFIAVDRPLPSGKPVIVMDSGGTNLRVAVVTFDATGTPAVRRLTRNPMPGTAGRLSAEAFFQAMLECLLPVIGESDAIGWCFSYPVEITPRRDGRLLAWTKQVQAPEVVGECVGSRLLALLRARGRDPLVTVLNDTVAALLAAKAAGPLRRYATYVGFILGTGTNTAYVERNRLIAKRADLDPEGAQPVNVESGGFTGCPRTDIDAAFDATTADPGFYPFEKMISGAYLGPLALCLLRTAAGEGLFGAATAARLNALPTLSTRDMDLFVANPFAAGPLDHPGMPDADRELIVRLAAALPARAALLAAVNIAAAMIKAGGGGPLHPVCANIDGTTYYKTAGLKSRVEEHLRRLLEPRGVFYDLVHIENAPLIGAAVAGLTAAG